LCSSRNALNSSAFVSQQASIFSSNVPIQSCCCQNMRECSGKAATERRNIESEMFC
jgi:hypothetical protein